MANSSLQGTAYSIEEPYQRYLGGSLTYEALKMRESRMQKAKDNEDLPEFNRLGGQDTLSYIQATLKTNRDSIENVKKIGMDAGRENQFIRKHEKDRDNANPTAVGGNPQMQKGSINRKIMSNKEVYNEGVEKEIKNIRYLIEYINNTKKTKK